MPSDLQQITQALLTTLDQAPHVVAHLQRTAAWCRQQITLVHQTYGATHPNGRELILLLDHAANRCDQAAHVLAQAPPKAHAWAQNLTADLPPAATAPPTNPTPAPTTDQPTTQTTEPQADRDVVELSTTDPDHHHTLRHPPPNTTLRVDGRFTYRTDHLGRVTHAIATLTTIDLHHPRDRTAQRDLPDKNPGDHAGHLFARIFQGPAATINLTPMHANVNQSAYRQLENRWAEAIKTGKSVDVTVELTYHDETWRPAVILVNYLSDGKRESKVIVNP